jgi:hypothetical protein
MRLVALVATVALVAAAAAQARQPRDPREAFTSADRAWARQIVLQRADLPGWRSTPPTPDDGTRCASFNPDMSDLTLTGRADSRSFERGAALVASVAEVYRSAPETQTSFRRAAKAAPLVRCHDETFRKQLGAGVRLVSGHAFEPPRVGERRLAIRLVWAARAAQQRRVYLDVIGWDRGRASAQLIVASFGTPPDAGLESRLARRMDARMRR